VNAPSKSFSCLRELRELDLEEVNLLGVLLLHLLHEVVEVLVEILDGEVIPFDRKGIPCLH